MLADSPLPLDEVVTPTLEKWDHRLGGWDTWIAPDEDFRVHVEMVDLEVPVDDAVLTGFEVRLDDLRGERPYPTVARLTVPNSHLAVAIAELLAADRARYVDEWDEGLAPRPADVGRDASSTEDST